MWLGEWTYFTVLTPLRVHFHIVLSIPVPTFSCGGNQHHQGEDEEHLQVQIIKKLHQRNTLAMRLGQLGQGSDYLEVHVAVTVCWAA